MLRTILGFSLLLVSTPFTWKAKRLFLFFGRLGGTRRCTSLRRTLQTQTRQLAVDGLFHLFLSRLVLSCPQPVPPRRNAHATTSSRRFLFFFLHLDLPQLQLRNIPPRCAAFECGEHRNTCAPAWRAGATGSSALTAGCADVSLRHRRPQSIEAPTQGENLKPEWTHHRRVHLFPLILAVAQPRPAFGRLLVARVDRAAGNTYGPCLDS